MIITISGLSGCGKSTAARLLAERLDLETVDVGKIFRKMAKRHKMDVQAFGLYAEKHPEIDRELDAAMITKARRARKGVVLQGRLAGWMTLQYKVPAYRIWLAASPQTRASRISGRESGSYAKILRQTMARDRANRARYRKTYALDLNDLSIYDSVVQTNGLSAEQVVNQIIGHISKVWRKKRPQPKNRKRLATPHRKPGLRSRRKPPKR